MAKYNLQELVMKKTGAIFFADGSGQVPSVKSRGKPRIIHYSYPVHAPYSEQKLRLEHEVDEELRRDHVPAQGYILGESTQRTIEHIKSDHILVTRPIQYYRIIGSEE